MLVSPCAASRLSFGPRSPAARQKTFPLLHFPLSLFTTTYFNLRLCVPPHNRQAFEKMIYLPSDSYIRMM